MEKLLTDLWPIFATFVGAFITFGIWIVRLESRVVNLENIKLGLEKTILTMGTEHDELKTKMYDQLSVIKETLARLEGFLQANKTNQNK